MSAKLFLKRDFGLARTLVDPNGIARLLREQEFDVVLLDLDFARGASLHLDTVARSVSERALSKHAWNVSRAAKELGLTRTSLYRRMEKYGL